ncbi:hypothetical protein BOTBODRAFT_26570 [Botryobasidium botryosum FD-172 SS1]|uniref:Uncharacterized protein n=1 Tax=Botryobasidium botryosum (strain FD-172 SS1) TaxID=930990 RepID=A0A067N8V6_BOTB1|nr:hypothetical protein BOTBODRAFT_26570 [Botryobasidium botryosum FD-172 SS1]
MSSSPNLFTADPHAIWESTWQVLVEVCPAFFFVSINTRPNPELQAAPPSVREILGAYNAKGEGDREMLLTIFL